MDLLKILCIIMVGAVLVSCIDCKTFGRCPRPSLVRPIRPCTTNRQCYPLLCCPNKQGREYCDSPNHKITRNTDVSKISSTTETSIVNAFKTALKESAVEMIKQIPSVMPVAIDAAKRAIVCYCYKDNINTGYQVNSNKYDNAMGNSNNAHINTGYQINRNKDNNALGKSNNTDININNHANSNKDDNATADSNKNTDNNPTVTMKSAKVYTNGSYIHVNQMSAGGEMGSDQVEGDHNGSHNTLVDGKIIELNVPQGDNISPNAPFVMDNDRRDVINRAGVYNGNLVLILTISSMILMST